MSLLYRVPGRSTVITYKGRTEFAQCSLPRPTKSEYGLDAMSLDYCGAAPLLPDFLKGLKQGKRFDFNGRQWFLHTYGPNDDNIWPTVSLNCIGLAEGELPEPKGDDSYVQQNITVLASVTEGDAEVNVTRDMNYRALQTTWIYPAKNRPTGPRVGKTSKPFNPQILSSVIEANGVRYNGANAPGNYAIATIPALQDVVLDLTAEEIFGTPYFNVQEVVCRMYVDA